jgi:hypothetical protein
MGLEPGSLIEIESGGGDADGEEDSIGCVCSCEGGVVCVANTFSHI